MALTIEPNQDERNDRRVATDAPGPSPAPSALDTRPFRGNAPGSSAWPYGAGVRRDVPAGEAAVERSHLTALFAAAPDAMLLLSADGTVLQANDAASGLFALAAEELRGRTLLDLMDGSDPRATIACAERRSSGAFAGEFSLRRGDGSCFEGAVRSSSFQEPGGRFLSYVVIRDESERVARERSLVESERRARTVIETTGSVLVGVAPDGRVVEWNRGAERLFGFSRSEVLGESYFDLIPDAGQREAVRAEIARVMDGAPARPREDTVISRDGEPRVVLWTITRLPDAGGRALGVIASGQDITERVQLKAQMQHAQKLESLGVLAGGIAHDFNNLLVGILGNASLALSDVSPDSEVHELLRDVETAALRAADLTKQMLAYSGRGQFVVGPLDLSAMVGEMAQLLQTVISKKATLRFDFAHGVPPVEGDATQLGQVVMNLITNASDALNGDSGTITLRTGRVWADEEMLRSPWLDYAPEEGDYALLEVTDTGIGMTAETMERVFDPFFSTKFTGRGLGLAATLGIVRGHRGSILLESAPGRGTTFRVYLPITSTPAAGGDDRTAAPTEPRGNGLALVVDDDPTVCAVARQMLERRGYRVQVAHDGVEGLAQFHRAAGSVRLALVDLTMPRMGGEELVGAIRAADRGVPVVLMSGFSEAEMAGRFAPSVVSACIQKPFRMEQLDSVLRRVGQRRGRSDDPSRSRALAPSPMPSGAIAAGTSP